MNKLKRFNQWSQIGLAVTRCLLILSMLCGFAQAGDPASIAQAAEARRGFRCTQQQNTTTTKTICRHRATRTVLTIQQPHGAEPLDIIATIPAANVWENIESPDVGFKPPLKVLGHFKIVNADTGELATDLPPQITLTTRVTAADLRKVDDPNDIMLGYDEGDNVLQIFPSTRLDWQQRGAILSAQVTMAEFTAFKVPTCPSDGSRSQRRGSICMGGNGT